MLKITQNDKKTEYFHAKIAKYTIRQKNE